MALRFHTSHILFITFIFCLAFFGGLSYAQSPSRADLETLLFPISAPPSDSVLFDDDKDLLAPEAPLEGPSIYDLLPDEYIKEAIEYVRACEQNTLMSRYYDCRCMGVEYLDERIQAGPEAPASQLALTLGPRCVDATGISGRFYEQCSADYLSVPVGFDIDEYCECYANTYSKLFENYGRALYSRDHVKLMSRARLTCRNPGLAQRFYGR